MTTHKQNLLESINYLVALPDPRYAVEALEATRALQVNFPVKLSQDLAVLNPLLALQRDTPEVWPRVQLLIDAKRLEAGLPPCWPAAPPEKFDKVKYQRMLMAERRAYSGRAALIENLQRPTSEKLRGNNRLEFERNQLLRWGSIIKEQVYAARSEQGTLTKAQENAIKSRFWENLESTLDDYEAAVRAELLKPPHQRRKI